MPNWRKNNEVQISPSRRDVGAPRHDVNMHSHFNVQATTARLGRDFKPKIAPTHHYVQATMHNVAVAHAQD